MFYEIDLDKNKNACVCSTIIDALLGDANSDKYAARTIGELNAPQKKEDTAQKDKPSDKDSKNKSKKPQQSGEETVQTKDNVSFTSSGSCCVRRD